MTAMRRRVTTVMFSVVYLISPGRPLMTRICRICPAARPQGTGHRGKYLSCADDGDSRVSRASGGGDMGQKSDPFLHFSELGTFVLRNFLL